MVETKEHQVKRGKRSRAQGGAFETRVRADLEARGWIVDKWSNNVELGHVEGVGGLKIDDIEVKKWEHSKLVQAKPKYLFINGGMKMVGNNSGFPDFIAMRRADDAYSYTDDYGDSYDKLVHEVIGVESKMTGELDRIEKEKCKWLLDNNVFSKILIASKHKIKNRIHIEYEDFKIKYYRFYDAK